MKSKNTQTKHSFNLSHLKEFLYVAFILPISMICILILPNKQVIFPHCANSISCIHDLSGQYQDNDNGVMNGKTITGPAIAAAPFNELSFTNTVLGASTSDDKHIYVDLTHQHLYAFEGTRLVYDFLISSGKWNPTPTGDFRIWIKLRYTRMTGGEKRNGDYYDLPNVPYTMYFANEYYPKSYGYGIEGAYWLTDFGHPMSHGNLDLQTADAQTLYYWTNPSVTGNVTYTSADNPGTPITIYGKTPKN